MRSFNNFYKILLVVLAISFSSVSFGSHIKAADIYAVRISSLQYKIVLTVYTDADRVGEFEELDETEAILYFNGNDSEKDPKPITVPRKEKTKIQSPSVFKNVFEYTYTVNSNNKFSVAYRGINRNANINNLGATNNSENYNIFIETIINHDGSLINSTPQLLIPPLDNANINSLYTHNPGGFDPDGDSLVFKLVEPRQYTQTDAQGQIIREKVPGYKSPADPSFGTPSTFVMDPVTGQITWNTPKKAGEYNVAFIVEEYRTYPDGSKRLLSTINRDMQILVEDVKNVPLILKLPKDTCITSSLSTQSGWKNNLYAWDTDAFQKVTVTAQGVFNTFGNSNLSLIHTGFGDTSVYEASWFPSCTEIRDEPYQITFKATDSHPDVPLSTIENMFITVLGVAPQNLQATNITSNEVILNWDSYSCNNPYLNFEIYRTNCDTSGIRREYCTGGVPEDWGFVKIDEVSITTLSYSDKTVKPGTTYYYVIAVNSKSQGGGKSYASNVSIASIPSLTPVITNVSVEKTSLTQGEIFIAWQDLFDTKSTYPSNTNFRIELYRSDDMDGKNFNASPIFTYSTTTQLDSFFIDKNLNTEEKSYSYKIKLFQNNTLAGESGSNSSVRIEHNAKGGRMDLSWNQNVMWYFPQAESQLIFMDSTKTNAFFATDSTLGGEYEKTIINLNDGKEYCFYIETKSKFCSNNIDSVYKNKSNITCGIPEDVTPPCPPILSIELAKCDSFIPSPTGLYNNILTWEDRINEECENDIEEYEIFFKPSLNESYTSIYRGKKEPINKYIHENLTSLAGCYHMIAIDGAGNKSNYSNEVCNNNCPYLEFPNVFTPNSDGKNDFFIPFPDPLFIKNIRFVVYSRWGNLVYNSNDETVNWNGQNDKGQDLSDGVYYYVAVATYSSTENQNAEMTINGWIYLTH